MALREELMLALEQSGVELPAGFNEESSLIRSGLLDSTALLNLVLWVEGRVGTELDPAAFDLTTEWETVRTLVSFIERYER